jgi:small-conductance mechanosensitive channel
LLLCAQKDPRVFKDPAPWAKLTALDASSVTVTLRAWTSAEDIGDAEADMVKRVKDTFEAEGLHFPYPHQVGLTREEAMAPPQPKAAKPTARSAKATEEAASRPARESTSSDPTSNPD